MILDPLPLLAQTGGPNQVILTIDRIARMPMSTVAYGALALTVVRVLAWLYLRKTAPHERFGFGFGSMRFLNDASDALVYAGIIVFFLVRPFGIQTFFIPTGSMVDTLLVNDYIVANKLVYRVSEPKFGDIIVFKPPKRALEPGAGNQDYIKRLIGLPGDLILWKDKQLYRNGKPVDEPYVDYTQPDLTVLPRNQWAAVPQANFKLVEDRGTVKPVQEWGDLVNAPGSYTHVAEEYAAFDQEEMRRLASLPPARVPEGYYLFMGDNRNGSFDSRGWGLVPREDLIGRAEFIFLPVSRWQRTR